MDIRTKLVFTLVFVALASMFAMGAVVSNQVEGLMRGSRLEQLDELAESRMQALLWVIEGWSDRIDLIASRTQLRSILNERAASGSAEARIQPILGDAVAAARGPTVVMVYDAGGELVASAARSTGPALPSGALPAEPRVPELTSYVGVEFGGSGVPQVTFVAPMTWDEQPIGSVVAAFEARELEELTRSYQGLGQSGETIIFAEDADGVVRSLHPIRDEPGAESVTLPSGPGSLVARAFASQPPSAGLADRRGESVWAATRMVEDTGWGLAVKIDAAEARQAYVDFNRGLVKTAGILAAFAILAGFGFGMLFAMPVHALAEVANRIRSGDMQARAKVTFEDEVGALTRTFNEMADELQQRMEELHEFHKFFDVSIDLMCIASTDGYFKRVNSAFKTVLGWGEHELLTRPFLDFVHPDDVEKTQNEVAKLAQGIPTISFENRYLRKDGGYALLRWTSYPEEGRLYAIAHVIDESLPG